jgi:hypothetical protein
MYKPKYNAYTEGHRSGLEDAFRDLCDKEGLTVGYETDTIPFDTPPQKRRYKPDWTVGEGCYIETKGRFTVQDRKKAILVKEQHPDIRILYVFQRSGNTISKASKTSYADWCKKNEIAYCDFRETEVWMKWIKEHQPKKGKKK